MTRRDAQGEPMCEHQSITVNWPFPAMPPLGMEVKLADGLGTVIGQVSSMSILDEGTENERAEVEITLRKGITLNEVFL